MSSYTTDLSLTGLVQNINYLSNNKENMDAGSAYLSGYILIGIFVILVLILFIWAIILLTTTKLPTSLFVLCIALLFIVGPVPTIIIIYIYKGQSKLK